VLYPPPLLEDGLVVIDTPGIGSMFTHNTEATLNFLPQCDAALFVASADPPMTQVEFEFLREVRARIPGVLVVLAKADLLEPDELRQASGFLLRLLCDNLGFPADTTVHAVSARQSLAAVARDEREAAEFSGIGAIRLMLLRFLAREKAGALESSIALKAADVLEEAGLQVRLAIQSLTLPIHDLQQRLAAFERKIEEIQRERLVAADLLAGDRRRAHELLEGEVDALRRRARAFLLETVKAELDRQEDATEAQVQHVLDAAIPSFFERELGAISARSSDHSESLLRAHQQRADGLLADLRKTASELFEVPCRAPEAAGWFELVREPTWVSRERLGTLSPIEPAFFDRLLPAAARRRRILDRLRKQFARGPQRRESALGAVPQPRRVARPVHRNAGPGARSDGPGDTRRCGGRARKTSARRKPDTGGSRDTLGARGGPGHPPGGRHHLSRVRPTSPRLATRGPSNPRFGSR